MTWNPYNDGVIENFHGSRKFAAMSDSDRNKVILSQLPSVRAMHHGGGSTVARSRKSAKKWKSARGSIMVSGTVLKKGSTKVAPMVSAGSEDFDLNLDDFDINCIKELTFSMAKKKEIRRRLKENNDMVVKSAWMRESRRKWNRFKEDVGEVLRLCQLWRSSIHEIEGRFGNGIRSYFVFLRWLFVLNLYIFSLVFFFICVPTVLFEYVDSTSVVVTSTNSSEQCEYLPYDENAVEPFRQYIIWWFTGQGFMENTLLFYGYYQNTVNSATTSPFSYNIPLAYILIAISYFLLSLVLIVKRAAAGVKESLTSGENRFYFYCNKVFGGWDFCITDDRAASLKHNSIKYELETDLEDERIRRKQAERTTKQKVILYTKRILINTIVLAVLAGSLAGIYIAAEFALQNSSTYDHDFFMGLLVTYLVSIVITVANVISPLLFEYLIYYEDYSPAFSIKFTLIRTVVLRLISVMFLYIVVYFQINCDGYGFIETTDSRNCGYCDGMPCWETYMGQEMYKLTIMDFFVVVGVTLFVEFPRRLIVDHCSCGLTKAIGIQEFSLSTNVLDIVYAQTVLWIGAFYAPLLPVIVVIKFFVFFYLKKLTLLYNCKPAERPYRASRSGTFFFVILMFGFLVAAIPVGVSIAMIPPSEYCGPFRGLGVMFFAVTNSLWSLPQWLANIFWFIGSSGFAVIIGVVLCLLLYYYVALGSAHKKMITLLREQLTLEGKDKQYLLKRVNELQMKMTGRASEDVTYSNRRRTPDQGQQRKNTVVAFENEDAKSAIDDLPGQTFVH